MHINPVFELTRIVDGEEFQRLFTRVQKVLDPGDGDEYVDRSLSHKGLTVVYRKSQYKKKVRLVINTAVMIGERLFDPWDALQKLNRRVRKYFGGQLSLEAFTATGVTMTADLPIGDQARVSAYLRVLRRLGRVKHFSPISYACFSAHNSFCLEGKSNDTMFMAYDLRSLLEKQLGKDAAPLLDRAKGVLRVEIRLTSARAVRTACGKDEVEEQLLFLYDHSQEVFLGVFQKIVPYGDSYKKGTAVELIRREICDPRLRRRMLRLLDLIPEKKSLLQAQKAMQCRRMDEVMDAFAKIGLSPVTISKRDAVQCNKNLYQYFT